MSTEQKIDNTFNRVMDDVNRLQKAFQPGKNLEKAIAEVGGDIAWLKDINEAFDRLYETLEEGHMGAVAHLQNEQLSKKKKIKPDTPVGMVAEGVLDADDDDGFMARSQLYFLARDAIQLHGIIDDRDDLEPWVQSKIAQASKDMDAVRRYTEYNAMKQEVEPEMEPAPEVESIVEDPSKPKFPIEVKLAGDSIWDEGDNPESVTVTDYKFNRDEEGYLDLHVMHDGPWTIYTDTGFEKAISDMVGMELSFSEQGMQQDGIAHLEGGDAMESLDETIRKIRSASSKLNQSGQGVRNKTNDETPYSVGEDNKSKKGVKKSYAEAKESIEEGMEFDEKRKGELQTVAQDMFKNALANAKKKAGK